MRANTKTGGQLPILGATPTSEISFYCHYNTLPI